MTIGDIQESIAVWAHRHLIILFALSFCSVLELYIAPFDRQSSALCTKYLFIEVKILQGTKQVNFVDQVGKLEGLQR